MDLKQGRCIFVNVYFYKQSCVLAFILSLVVTPQILESSDEIVDLPVERRSCKFITEPNTLGMFKTYAHKSCIFECMYKNAKDWCGCVPWSYPTFGNGSNLCDIYGNLCFAYQMTNGTHLTTCDCQNECNKISYTYFTNLQELKPSDCVRNCAFIALYHI